MPIDVNKYSLSELLPHADPMILVSRLIDADEESIECEVVISQNSMFYEERMSGVPAWVGIEYMAQTIGVYAGIQAKAKDVPVKLGFLLGSRRYESEVNTFFPGDILQVKVTRLYQEENGLGGFGCEIFKQGQLVCHGKLNVFSPENADEFFKVQGS